MANQRIKMQKLKKLIELTISGTAQRPISTIFGIHRRTVVNYQGLLKSHTGGELSHLSEAFWCGFDYCPIGFAIWYCDIY